MIRRTGLASLPAACRTVVRLERRAGPKGPVGGMALASAPITLKPGAPGYLKIDARGGTYDFPYSQLRVSGRR